VKFNLDLIRRDGRWYSADAVRSAEADWPAACCRLRQNAPPMTEQPELLCRPARSWRRCPAPSVDQRAGPAAWCARLMERVLAPWIRSGASRWCPVVLDRPVCYVRELRLSNALILDRACREAGPSPFAPLPNDPLAASAPTSPCGRGNNESGARQKSYSQGLSRLLMAHRLNPGQDVQLVPVSIFVGRAPARQSGWFSVLFSEHWALVGRFRRLLAILLNGRDTVVQFSPSFPVRDILAEELPHERTVRKTSRVLRAHFRKIRAAVIGPDLSTRRLLVDRVLDAEPARTTTRPGDGSEYLEAWKKAHRHLGSRLFQPGAFASFGLTGFPDLRRGLRTTWTSSTDRAGS
jgi:glycerol-3-phosphate O-acyltransferase